MKRKLIRLSRRYATALRNHLKQGRRASLKPARGLGRQAVSLGLETLDVARIHERALATLEASGSRNGVVERADIFFTETISPIEETHRAALKVSARLNRLKKTLDQRTLDLAAANRSLKQGIVRSKTVEAALKKRVEHCKKQLEESLPLQKHLHHLTRRILAAHENKRKKISHHLQDEIAQTLLAINIRLLTVKKAADLNDESLQKEIASTQRLVDISVKTIERFACEYGKHQET